MDFLLLSRLMERVLFIIGSALLFASGCASPHKSGSIDLIGAWRAKIQFKDGAFAAVKDLEFMYVFNAGGTMTESSNYDSAPPVPPAYGLWRKTGSRQFEAKYTFYITKAPTSFDDVLKVAVGCLTATARLWSASHYPRTGIRLSP